MKCSPTRLGFAILLTAVTPALASAGRAFTGRLITPRYAHSATLLPDGRVLVAGGYNNGPVTTAEIYSPTSGVWTPTGSMATARSSHTATLLGDGTVLVAGGTGLAGAVNGAEVYDPRSGSWRPVGGLLGPRSQQTATLLRDGTVLVVGGVTGGSLDGAGGLFGATPLASAELYIPSSQTWQPTGSLQIAHPDHTANLLADGRVLVTATTVTFLGSGREIYDPTSGLWTTAATFIEGGNFAPISRDRHSSTVLADGRVLSVGGAGASGGARASTEIYDPVADVAIPSADLAEFAEPSATLLPDGRVLVAGGVNTFGGAGDPEGVSQTAAWVYDPSLNTWSSVDPLGHQRTKHTATLLPDGRVLIAGGIDPQVGGFGFQHLVPGNPVADVELYDLSGPSAVVPSSVVFDSSLPVGSLAKLLGNGQVLLALSGQLWDPATGARTATGAPTGPHDTAATVTSLVSGRVLLAGGTGSAAAEIYDPSTGLWAPTGSLAAPRSHHTATLLPDGRVLVVGGLAASGPTAAVEVFDPASGIWAAAAPLSTPRTDHTATLLADGRVLVVGGAAEVVSTAGSLPELATFLGSAEIFDPASGAWAATGALATTRARHAAVLLPDGQVLVLGGTHEGDPFEGGLTSAERYEPATGTWTPTGSLVVIDRIGPEAVALPNGKVLVVGGYAQRDGLPPKGDPVELYDPATGAFTAGPAVCSRIDGGVTLLPDGRVLLSGIGNFPCPDQTFEPNYGLASRRPHIVSTSGGLAFGTPFSITGSRFRGDSEAGSGKTSSSAANIPVVQLRSIENGLVTSLAPDARANLGDEPLTLQFSRLPASLNPGLQIATAFVDGMPSLPSAAGGAGVVGLSCSIAITTPPVNQTVALGTSATFSVAAQGARSYQWRKDGIAISGATGTSYTTPPIQGADSGSLYDVVVNGPCASATSAPAALTVADAIPPLAAVIAPSGGEYFLLSPLGGPASTEQITWSMSDNVRVCQVRVSLLYSNDGGLTYLAAPAGGGLPQVFGAGGSCAFPGVNTTNLTYSIPTTYPSGKSGSLYRIQVDVSDQVGLHTVVESQNPFYIVQSNPDVRTLILSNTSRMRTVMGITAGQAAALDTKLRDLSVHPRVQGVVVDLGLVSALDPYYAAFDAAVASQGDSVKAANDLLFGPNGIHAQVLSKLRAFPGVRYVTLVGDDRIIPLARIPDGTALFDESNYPAGGDLSGTNTAVGQALQAKRFLSDDPLGLVTAFTPDALSTSLFLPDLSVGRLVETPEEITTAIATFIGQDGVLDLGALDSANGHKVLVTGYDFLQDSAVRIRDRWKAVLGVAGSPVASQGPVDGSLVGANWGISAVADRRAALLARFCGNGSTRYGIASLSGHATHFLEGVPADSGSFTDIEGLAASGLLDANACGAGRGVDLSGGIVYSVGCHSGLPVPGSNPLDVDRSLDLPQTLLSRGVVAYVANSGYGWGPKFGPGYSKRLMEILTELLAVPGTVVTGDAVRSAKLRYFDQTGSPDPYDTKSLMQWTLYGLPMYAVKTGIAAPAASAAALVQNVAASKAAGKASVETIGSVTVARQTASLSANAAVSAVPPSLTQLDLRFDFTAAGVYQKQGATGGLLTTPGCSDPNGCYYTLNGLATGKTDLPVQPYFVYDSRLSGTSQHGVLWKGGTYDQESGWKPVITELASNGGDGSDHGVAPRQIIDRPTAPRRVPGGDPTACAASDSEVNSLVVTTGEVLTAQPMDAPYSTERRFRDVNLEVLYFNQTADPSQNCDRSGPTIAAGPLPGGLYHSVDGNLIQWAVPATDPAGVWRVVVVVNDNSLDSLSRGRWTPVELAVDSAGLWRGSFTASGAGTVTYMLQAVDNRGNVSWLDFTVAAAASAQARTQALSAAASSTGLPSSGVPLRIPLPVDVVVSGPAGPHVDAFSPPSGLVGASVSIFGRNFAGTTRVAFNGTTASYVEISPTNLMAVVPAGATTGPISVTTAFGVGTSATSFTVVPGLSVGDVTVTRPVSGTLSAAFTVALAPTATSSVTVQYRTIDGTAQAGVDYTATTGTLTFGAGAASKIVNVPILGNGASGPPRTFSLELFNPANAGLLRARGDGTILRPWRVSDWNGDGKADVLWQQESTGELALWAFDATKRIGALSLSPDRVPDRKLWTAGSGDFNGDGQTDLVLQHQTTGAVSVWLMNGLTRTRSVVLSPARPVAWRIAGVADWNGDNGADLVWQNTATGAVEIWYLNGTVFVSSAAVTPSRPVVWQIAGAADWNGDGKPDLLWQNQSTGDLEVWYMNGATRVSTAPLSPSKPSSPFKLLAAVGDFSGDGKPDLLFRDPLLGSLAIWVMNGTSRTSTVTPSGVNYPGELPTTPGRVLFDVKWQIVLPK
jgi:Calx-beta domain/FG-GAP-like repeat/Galactose oxidase, central domain/Kelch motif